MVFQPTWSTWRWVHSTVSIDLRGYPAAARSSRNGPCRSFHVGIRRFCLSLPRHVSTMSPRRRLHHEAVDAHAQPAILVGEMRAQPGDRLDFLARRLRQDKRLPPVTSSSTILVTVTSPIRHCIAASRLVPTHPPYHDPAPTREETEVAQHIDYYASLNSPWTHLGAARIEALAAKQAPSLRIWPVDFGTVFAGSGGLPLPKRAPQRQAYRLMELRRWRDFLGVPNQHRAKILPGQRGAHRNPASSRCARPRATPPPSSWRIACCALCGRTS